MKIAIDGPAGAGKSTVARQLAQELGCAYLDTGAMYRAIAYGAAKRGVDIRDDAQVLGVLPELSVDVKYDPDGQQRTFLNGQNVSEEIRSTKCGWGASVIATIPEVRLYLAEQQRRIAEREDIILDGRDIGSFVLPDADFKFFLTASVDARAERRYRELAERGETCDLDTLRTQIAERDAQDMNREFAPLTHSEGEILVDTSNMTQDQVVRFLANTIHGA